MGQIDFKRWMKGLLEVGQQDEGLFAWGLPLVGLRAYRWSSESRNQSSHRRLFSAMTVMYEHSSNRETKKKMKTSTAKPVALMLTF